MTSVYCLGAIASAIVQCAPAMAQWSTESGLEDCEKLAAVKFKEENTAFKNFTINRADVEDDKFADKVGSQYVATVFHGKAIYDAFGKQTEVRFICLHGGAGKGAVFVYMLPD